MLDFSKLEVNSVSVEKNRFFVNSILDTVVISIAPGARKKGLIIEKMLSDQVPQVVIADEQKILQILLNLAHNAVKFTSAAQLQLFEPFIQVDSGHGRRYGGTGLGLSIAKRFVELMDGEIGVSSKTGRGSIFWFSVPVELVQ